MSDGKYRVRSLVDDRILAHGTFEEMTDYLRSECELSLEPDETASEDENELRRLLWITHGCESPMLYGDDGEMQCNSCFIDFKRMEPTAIGASLALRKPK